MSCKSISRGAGDLRLGLRLSLKSEPATLSGTQIQTMSLTLLEAECSEFTSDPEEVTLEPVGKDQVILRWSPIANGQTLDEFVAVIRHSTTKTALASGTSQTLRTVEARTTYAILPLLEGEYFVKFENNQKVKSQNAASAVIDLPDQLPLFN